jgi:V/A-type H+-transporting ATPase subunit E
MSTEAEQVRALQRAILERARELSAEHVAQARMSRDKILEDAHEKIKLMEQNEMLAAKINADREYLRLVQASELHNQAELDRNRWGLLQSVMDRVRRRLVELRGDERRYRKLLGTLLAQAADRIDDAELVATLNDDDRSRYQEEWQALVAESCGDAVQVALSPRSAVCSGGIRLSSKRGDVMVDNSFEGILERRERELHQLIFERLFATLPPRGALFDG